VFEECLRIGDESKAKGNWWFCCATPDVSTCPPVMENRCFGLVRERLDMLQDVFDLPRKINRRSRHWQHLFRLREHLFTKLLGCNAILGEEPLVRRPLPA